MEANELRIGNLVEYLGEFKEVLGMDEETVFLKNTVSVNYLELDEISPISLTEELLLKFGFINNELLDKHLIFLWFGDHVGIKGMLGLIKPWSCVYVHQLQNLYFALTNNELIFKS